MNNPSRGAEALRQRRRRSSGRGSGGSAQRRGRSVTYNETGRGSGGCLKAFVWIGLLGTVLLGGILIAGDETRRAEIAAWLSSQLGSTPTPIPVVITIPDTPTPAVTPNLPASATVALMPTSTPTPQPTPSPTAEPTATEIPSPTSEPPEYSIDDVDVKPVAISDGMFSVDFSVLFRNVSAGTGQRPVELLMSVDEGEPELITIISGLAPGESESFVFSRKFSPGRYSVTLIAGDAHSEVSIDVAPATVSLVLPTATPTVTETPPPTETPALPPTVTPTSEPTSTPHPSPTEIVLQASPTPTPTVPAVVSDSEVAPHLRHLEYKQYMLELINAERTRAGLGTVILGNNNAAQLHAEASIEHCFSSHWGIDGLKPYMRYSLSGGYQSNAENGSGSDYCIVGSDGYRALGSIKHEILQAMDGWMDSPGHRRNILRPWHRKVNIGISWDRYNFAAYQHFEGDYVEYDQMPLIQDGILTMMGTLKNGATIKEDRDLGVQIYYDSPPHPLTQGQVSRTYCYDSGLQVAGLRRPLSGNWFYEEHRFTKEYNPCPDPYDVPPGAPAPQSHEEAHEFWQAAYDASQLRKGTTITAPWITADKWGVGSDNFSVTADLGNVIRQYGDGVYTVMVWATIAEERAVISQYSIFRGVTPPDTYTIAVGDR